MTQHLGSVYYSLFWGKNPWDWREYMYMMGQTRHVAIKTFEKDTQAGVEKAGDAPQGNYVLHMTPVIKSVEAIDVLGSRYTRSEYRMAVMTCEVWVDEGKEQPPAYMEFRGLTGDSLFSIHQFDVLDSTIVPGQWNHVRKKWNFPLHYPVESHYILWPSNPNGADFRLDEIRLELH